MATQVQLSFLTQPETLRRGDKLLELRYYNEQGEFVCSNEVMASLQSRRQTQTRSSILFMRCYT